MACVGQKDGIGSRRHHLDPWDLGTSGLLVPVPHLGVIVTMNPSPSGLALGADPDEAPGFAGVCPHVPVAGRGHCCTCCSTASPTPQTHTGLELPRTIPLSPAATMPEPAGRHPQHPQPLRHPAGGSPWPMEMLALLGLQHLAWSPGLMSGQWCRRSRPLSRAGRGCCPYRLGVRVLTAQGHPSEALPRKPVLASSAPRRPRGPCHLQGGPAATLSPASRCILPQGMVDTAQPSLPHTFQAPLPGL